MYHSVQISRVLFYNFLIVNVSKFCCFLCLLVVNLSSFFTLNSKEKYHFSIWYKHLAFAHWSKIFEYLILSQIIVLLGKLNVSVRDSFTHFYSWLYSIQRSHQGTASTAKCAWWGRLSITSQSLSMSMKVCRLVPRCVCPVQAEIPKRS